MNCTKLPPPRRGRLDAAIVSAPRRVVRRTVGGRRGGLLTVLAWALVGPMAPAAELEASRSPAAAIDHVPPDVAPRSSEASESMSAMSLPAGLEVRLFAAEPEIANVVAFDVDHAGRVMVAETFRQSNGVTDNRAHDDRWLLADLSSRTVQDRIDYHHRLLGPAAADWELQTDRLRRVYDDDGDGRADRSSIFATGFHSLEEGTGAGVLQHRGDTLYTCIPRLWRLGDADDDGVAESREVIADGFGVRVAFRGHDMHGPIIGPDGRLYFTIGDRGYNVVTAEAERLASPDSGAVFRCELDGSAMEVFATGLRNPQELAFDDHGRWFTVDNNSDSGDQARIVRLLRHGDSGWRMHYQYLDDRGPFNRMALWKPRGLDHPAHLVPPVANFTDGPSGLTFYPGTGFGDRFENQFLICDFRGGPSNSGIRSFKIEPRGAFSERVSDGQPFWKVLATDVAFTPDGGLMISDWVDGWDGLGKGRIYKVTDPQAHQSDLVREVRDWLAGDVTKKSVDALVDGLGHADRRIRLASQWELAIRGRTFDLAKLAAQADLPITTRRHAVWALGHAGRLDAGIRPSVVTTLESILDETDLRVAVLTTLPDVWFDSTMSPRVVELLGDDDPEVRYAAAMAVASHPDGRQAALDLGTDLASTDDLDPALRHAATMLLVAAGSPQRVAGLTKSPSIEVRRSAVAALRRTGSGLVERFLIDEHPEVQIDAAAAIFDAPISVAAESLAALLDNPSAASLPALVLSRAIEMQWRLGTPVAAKRLAWAAANLEFSESLRIEALRLLSLWNSEDPRSRLTGEIIRRAERQPGIAAEALDSRIDSLLSASPEVRRVAVETATALGMKKVAPQLIAQVRDDAVSPAARAAALVALIDLDAPSASSLALRLARQEHSELAIAAVEALGRLQPDGAVAELLRSAWEATPEVRGAAWDQIAGIDDPAVSETIQTAVAKWIAGDLPAELHLNVLQAAEKRLPPQSPVRLRLRAFRDQVAAADPLGKYLVSLAGGDPAAGSDLFFNRAALSCQRCHQVDRAGGQVGPNLTLIGRTKDRRYLLEAICLPSATTAQGYETAVIADDEGTVFTGIVSRENEVEIELIDAQNRPQLIEKQYIVARRKGQSSMPAGLAELMTPRELRDLVAYLASLTYDRRADQIE